VRNRIATLWILGPRMRIAAAGMMLIAFVLGYLIHPA
jgi:hypothetical protein